MKIDLNTIFKFTDPGMMILTFSWINRVHINSYIGIQPANFGWVASTL